MNDDAEREQRRAEGHRLQALLPPGSNRRPERGVDYVDAAVELAGWGVVGFCLAAGALVVRRVLRRRPG